MRHDQRPTDIQTAVGHCLPEQTQTSCAAPAWWPERCAQNPIPSRTRPLNTPAPMVLCLKTRESRSPPGLPSTSNHIPSHSTTRTRTPSGVHAFGAGWSSPVARQAHNLKVAGSNPAPATNAHTYEHSHTSTASKRPQARRPTCPRAFCRSRYTDRPNRSQTRRSACVIVLAKRHRQGRGLQGAYRLRPSRCPCHRLRARRRGIHAERQGSAVGSGVRSPREACVHRLGQPVTARCGSGRACTPRRGDRAIGSRRSSGPEPGSASGRRPRPLPVSAHR